MAEAILKYLADDGRTEFHTKAEAEAFDMRDGSARLVGLTALDISAAIAGESPKIADAIEEVGNLVRKARLERGDNRRGKKSGGAE